LQIKHYLILKERSDDTALRVCSFQTVAAIQKERSRERERATQRGCVLTSSVGLWEGPLGVRITQCPYGEQQSTQQVGSIILLIR
jgi:hypothetical protein